MKRFKKSLSWAMALCMVLTLLPAMRANALAADAAGSGRFLVSIEADPSTAAVPGDFGAAAGDGRIWTDKTVAVNGGTFDVTLSALAQEYM